MTPDDLEKILGYPLVLACEILGFWLHVMGYDFPARMSKISQFGDNPPPTHPDW